MTDSMVTRWPANGESASIKSVLFWRKLPLGSCLLKIENLLVRIRKFVFAILRLQFHAPLIANSDAQDSAPSVATARRYLASLWAAQFCDRLVVAIM
jgi:hypothetical protein